MKLTYTLAWVCLLVAVLFAQAAPAADLTSILLNRELGIPVTRYAATDGNIAMRIKYIGGTNPVSAGDYSVAVAAGGDITLEEDDGTVDTTVSTDGVIDVSDAAEDTWGEVADAINASDNWQCILVDVLPSHSANDTLLAVSETGSGLLDEEGLALLVDLDVADEFGLSIGPEYTTDEVLSVSNDNLLNRKATPFQSFAPTYTCELYYATSTATYSSGAPDLEVYAVKDHGAGATELLLWSQVGAASGSASNIDLTDLPPLRAPRGWRLVVIYDDDSTPDLTAATMRVHGLIYEQ